MSKVNSRSKIKMRIRKLISGTQERPRLSVFRSSKAIYVQLIDDLNGVTVLASSSNDKDFSTTGTKIEIAKAVGINIAEKAKNHGIDTVVFDRNGYLYHGRVKALAEGAREGGLKL